METQSVYIRTVFKNYNYGSVLQCYALSKIMTDLGYKVEVVDENQNSPKGKIMLFLRRVSFIKSCIVYPKRYRTYRSIKNNSLEILSQVTSEQKILFRNFINKKIPVREMTIEEMISSFSEPKCKAVISGSDQIWGTGGPYLNQANFLQYAPKEKRFSYAASIGVSKIPVWFRQKFKKYLNEYNKISVREETLKNELLTLGIQNSITVSLDPTLILPLEEWIKLAEESKWSTNNRYIFMYFINQPSEFAIRKIKELINYYPDHQLLYMNEENFKSFNKLKAAKRIVLGPEDFLKVVKDSALVITDSFHGSIFSVKFHKQFIVFNRQYSAQSNQSSRILDFLKLLDLSDRFCKDDLPLQQIDYTQVDLLLDKKINDSLDFLKGIEG